MSDVSEEALLDYFCSSGGNSGRVRNADILRTFKPFIGHSDAQLRAKYREEFKLVIDRVAVVKSENGEKFLVLKKKYRQQLQERDGDGQRRLSPAGTAAGARWDSPDADAAAAPPPPPAHQLDRQDEDTSRGEEQRTGAASVQHPPPPLIRVQVPSEPSPGDDELDKDSGSKSESEQDEESTGSMGSAAVALDPIEKEWIYSAAGARVPDLSQLLRQDPSLANKKDFTSGFTALHWAAKHGNKDMAALVANAGADVNTKSHGGYTALHIAALHGHQHILDLLVRTYGAKENLRDYSGHLAFHYLSAKEPDGPEEECELPLHVTQARERNRNRKLVALFHSKKKWGSAEELAPIEEERAASHQLVPPPFRPRKFSR